MRSQSSISSTGFNFSSIHSLIPLRFPLTHRAHLSPRLAALDYLWGKRPTGLDDIKDGFRGPEKASRTTFCVPELDLGARLSRLRPLTERAYLASMTLPHPSPFSEKLRDTDLIRCLNRRLSLRRRRFPRLSRPQLPLPPRRRLLLPLCLLSLQLRLLHPPQLRLPYPAQLLLRPLQRLCQCRPRRQLLLHLLQSLHLWSLRRHRPLLPRLPGPPLL